jgi:virginiamycin B lyase
MPGMMLNKLKLILAVFFPLPLVAQTGNPVIVDMNKVCFKEVTMPGRPDFITASGNYAWVIDDGNSRIRKITVKNSKPLLTVTIPVACAAPVIAFNAVWVLSCAERKLYKIDMNTGRILAKIATGVADPNGEMSLAAGNGSLWMLSDSSGVLTRINPDTDTVQARVKVNRFSYCAGFGYGAVWVTSSGESTVQKVDVKTNTVVATIPVGKNPRFLSVGERGVWTLNQGDGTVTRIDAATNKVIATIAANAKGPGGDIAEDGSKVWIVSTNKNRPVQTIDAASNKIETIYSQANGDGKEMRVDGAVRASGRFIWISGLYYQKVWIMKK